MKTALFTLPIILGLSLASVPFGTLYAGESNPGAQAVPAPTTSCRYVPERSDDFAWENDLVAFRVYGPALRKGAEDSGIDCWAKRVSYPVIDKWYRLDREQKQSYHKDHGEGADFYHVGSSRGCGGTAIWRNGRMVRSNVYREWKILEQGTNKTVFLLTYEYHLRDRKIREEKTITIRMGERLFKSESVFTEDDKPADLEIAVGITTHDQKGEVEMDRQAGWMQVWEKFGHHGGFGTGVAMEPRRITGMEELKSDKRDESHVILRCRTDARGRTVHYVGYAWEKAGGITTPQQWAQYLAHFIGQLDQNQKDVEAVNSSFQAR